VRRRRGEGRYGSSGSSNDEGGGSGSGLKTVAVLVLAFSVGATIGIFLLQSDSMLSTKGDFGELSRQQVRAERIISAPTSLPARPSSSLSKWLEDEKKREQTKKVARGGGEDVRREDEDNDVQQSKRKRGRNGDGSTLLFHGGHSVIPAGVPGTTPAYKTVRTRHRFNKEAILMERSSYRKEKREKEMEKLKRAKERAERREAMRAEAEGDDGYEEDESTEVGEEELESGEVGTGGDRERQTMGGSVGLDNENDKDGDERGEAEVKSVAPVQAVEQPEPGSPYRVYMDDESFCITPSYKGVHVRPTLANKQPPKYGKTFSTLDESKNIIEFKCKSELTSAWLYNDVERRSWKGKAEEVKEGVYTVEVEERATEVWVGCDSEWNFYTFVRRSDEAVRRAKGAGGEKKRSVLLLTLDSTSNMDFKRSYPRTLGLLKSLQSGKTVKRTLTSPSITSAMGIRPDMVPLSEEVASGLDTSKTEVPPMHVVYLNQHHAERDYTDPNHITLLTGLHMDELEKTSSGVHLIGVRRHCWEDGKVCSDFDVYPGYPYENEQPASALHCNTCIFNVAKAAGYVTTFGRYSAMDHFSRRIDNLFGFRDGATRPTDHEMLRPYRDPRFAKKKDVNKPRFRLQFDHIFQFFSTYTDVARFASIDLKDGHDKDMSSLDLVLAEFLTDFLSLYGDTTLLALVGDHGPHYAANFPIRDASEMHAAFEVVNPLAVFLFPKGWKEAEGWAEALLHNSERLTTHTDVYCTLKHRLLEGGEISEEILPDPSDCFDLFSHAIDEERSCVDANLDYCLCNCKARKQQKRQCGPARLSRITGKPL